jgi:DNA-binding transcriptional regulator LsrR (DeoR family)
MGIGAPVPNSILVREGTIVTWPQLSKLAQRGAVGDMNLRYFDKHGKHIRSELDDNVIGLTLDEIKKIHHVVGIAGGATKFRAVRGALDGKLIHALITDHTTARRLLESPDGAN